MIDDWQSNVLHKRHRVHFDMWRDLIDYRLWHFFQLAENDVRRFIIEMLLNALVLEVVWGVPSMQLRDRTFVVFLFTIGIVILLLLRALLLLFMEANSPFAQIL